MKDGKDRMMWQAVKVTFRQYRSGESGSIIVMAALGLFLLFGVFALAIDMGSSYKKQNSVQTAMDACVMRGTQEVNYWLIRDALDAQTPREGILCPSIDMSLQACLDTIENFCKDMMEENYDEAINKDDLDVELTVFTSSTGVQSLRGVLAMPQDSLFRNVAGTSDAGTHCRAVNGDIQGDGCSGVESMYRLVQIDTTGGGCTEGCDPALQPVIAIAVDMSYQMYEGNADAQLAQVFTLLQRAQDLMGFDLQVGLVPFAEVPAVATDIAMTPTATVAASMDIDSDIGWLGGCYSTGGDYNHDISNVSCVAYQHSELPIPAEFYSVHSRRCNQVGWTVETTNTGSCERRVDGGQTCEQRDSGGGPCDAGDTCSEVCTDNPDTGARETLREVTYYHACVDDSFEWVSPADILRFSMTYMGPDGAGAAFDYAMGGGTPTPGGNGFGSETSDLRETEPGYTKNWDIAWHWQCRTSSSGWVGSRYGYSGAAPGPSHVPPCNASLNQRRQPNAYGLAFSNSADNCNAGHCNIPIGMYAVTVRANNLQSELRASTPASAYVPSQSTTTWPASDDSGILYDDGNRRGGGNFVLDGAGNDEADCASGNRVYNARIDNTPVREQRIYIASFSFEDGLHDQFKGANEVTGMDQPIVHQNTDISSNMSLIAETPGAAFGFENLNKGMMMLTASNPGPHPVGASVDNDGWDFGNQSVECGSGVADNWIIGGFCYGGGAKMRFVGSYGSLLQSSREPILAIQTARGTMPAITETLENWRDNIWNYPRYKLGNAGASLAFHLAAYQAVSHIENENQFPMVIGFMGCPLEWGDEAYTDYNNGNKAWCAECNEGGALEDHLLSDIKRPTGGLKDNLIGGIINVRSQLEAQKGQLFMVSGCSDAALSATIRDLSSDRGNTTRGICRGGSEIATGDLTPADTAADIVCTMYQEAEQGGGHFGKTKSQLGL